MPLPQPEERRCSHKGRQDAAPTEERIEESRFGVDSCSIEYPPDGSAKQIAPTFIRIICLTKRNFFINYSAPAAV